MQPLLKLKHFKESVNVAIVVPALALLQGETNKSPTVLGVRTSFKVQTGPYGYCVACPGGVLIKSASWGRRRHQPVSAGPN